MGRMLYKGIVVTCLLLVTFFSVNFNVSAANFKYSDFNWEEFLEQNKNHWISSCDEGDENCYDRILKTQEKFYKRLYKLLTKFERKGFALDDNVIIATVFYAISPNSFKDPVEGENNAYNLDAEDDATYIAEADDIEAAKAYFESEKDSLKTLMNNMIGYTRNCYGVTDVTPTNDAYGNLTCGDYIPYDGVCVEKVDVLKSSFFESLGIFKSDNEAKCASLTSSYSGYKLGKVSSEKEVNLELYWDFLTESNYFDKKYHLQSYFETVLRETGHKTMSELDSTEYEKYESEIKDCRTRIINGIKSVIETNEKTASKVSMMKGAVSTYWWPIGSSETTESDGIIMAINDPSSINVINKYGLAGENMNNGIDISGIEGETNVIAAREGTVVSLSDDNGGSCVTGDTGCGSGYGNFIIIQHIDNNYTVYAHLAQGSISVKSGDVVKQGQVIGKVGNTGDSVQPHLHFEVRVGGTDPSSSQDPLLFVSADNPREVSIQGDLIEWIGVMEGTGPMDGDNYVVYDDGGGVLTFGHGIAIIHNKDLINAHGINPNTLNLGSLVPKIVADQIYASLVPQKLDAVKAEVSARGITLTENQIAALVSLKFNTGGISDFFEPYNTYGATENLCNNWWHNFKLYNNQREYQPGLASRRKVECDAFVNGNYNMNPYGG